MLLTGQCQIAKEKKAKLYSAVKIPACQRTSWLSNIFEFFSVLFLLSSKQRHMYNVDVEAQWAAVTVWVFVINERNVHKIE